MNVLVLGGTHFIGRALVRVFLDSGCSVTVLNRGTKKVNIPNGVTLIQVDRKSAIDLNESFRVNHTFFDAVIDLSGYNDNDVKLMVNVLTGHFSHYMFCSSAAVYKQPPRRFPFTEDSDKCAFASDNEYGFLKWKAEQELERMSLRLGFCYTIIRPVYVYGPMNDRGREEVILSRVRSNKPIYLEGSADVPIQFSYVTDLAKIMVMLASNKGAFGKTFNVGGSKLHTAKEFVQSAISVIGNDVPIFTHSVGGDVIPFPLVPRYSDTSEVEKVIVLPDTSLCQGLFETNQYEQNGEKNER